MTASVLAYQTRSSGPVFALDGLIVASATVGELQRRVEAARADGHRLIVIDVLGAGPRRQRILT